MCLPGGSRGGGGGSVFTNLFRNLIPQETPSHVTQSQETIDEGGMRARILQRRRAAALGGSRSTQNTGGAGTPVTGQSKSLLGL